VRSSVLRRLAPALLLVALLGTACDTTANNAAVVNGHGISAKAMTDELKVIRCNSTYRQALEQSYGGKLAGQSEGTFNNTFVSQLLAVRIYYTLLEQRLHALGTKITSADLAKARTTTDEQLDSLGKSATKCFPTSYKDKLIRQEALIEVAQTAAAKTYLDQLEIACASHILVKTKAEADALKKQLDAGADFAALAKASSIDTGSKDQGGDLGCQPAGTFVAAFDKAVTSLPIGKVSDPVKTEFGYHLILVHERRPGTEADLTSDSGQQALNTFLLDVVCGRSAHVSITPSYGTWNRSKCASRDGLASVEPPAQPKRK
jgi:hypothetical protein